MSNQTYMKNLKDEFLKNNQMMQIILNEFIYHFQQDLIDPASTLIAIEKTLCIMIEDYKPEFMKQ